MKIQYEQMKQLRVMVTVRDNATQLDDDLIEVEL